ncbi:phospholipid/cholesterol/gamma-HCH transport system permease protein [Herbaspirillum sp. Sphag1AN]|uniref:ABC transporter permease n=1 Tax=unclassified Herbaspirillum TaxID=2624150 RepID=UPI001621996B|nr:MULTISPECIES: ABC transporter permease [unclassified Herbaspirillum]MBB3213397.1 phospholipid/cholesterol/gamma-HCH transport system permease protein [Herbaspirillum sp. Sphag1AN]MBB3246559.1 phospholipid/cholesterol/gamma-HCH transport system permease protein [Herbaspirillum sp. Sphag64]
MSVVVRSTATLAATLHLEQSSSQQQLKVGGEWTLANYRSLQQQIVALQLPSDDALSICVQQLTALDTAGAALLTKLLGTDRAQRLAQTQSDLPAAWKSLLAMVATSTLTAGDGVVPRYSWLSDMLVRIGAAVCDAGNMLVALLGFIGLTLQTLLRDMLKPSQWRVTATVAQLEQTCLDAVPIVALLNFMVGAVVAFLGATVLVSFGAAIFTVDLVAFSFLREFAVLLTAILMAGRTASAFTAQIGAMKANEEIDAIRALGLDPVNLLVLPRMLALLVAMPLLTFIAMMAGLLGGAVVCAFVLDINPTMFLTLLHQNVGIRHFFLGMAKAPVFACVVALIGCLEGFKVSGSAQSVGAHTTSSVVQSIFLVILIDALAALFYMEMGW